MRIVLDTNVVIAGLVADGLCRDLLKRRVLGHELFVSRELILELADKLRTKFGEDPEGLPLFQAYRERAQVVVPTPLPAPVCRDPDDDLVLGTAMAAAADAIVSGDDDLLVLREYEGVTILSPRDFLERLDREEVVP